MIDKIIFPKSLPPNATLEQINQHVRYLQEQTDFKLKQIIEVVNDLESRVEELEGS